MIKNIQTILFDLDGTLINTNELILESFNHTFNHFGLSFTRDELVKFNGPPLRETFQKLDKDRAEDMIKVYREHNLNHHEAYVTPFPNVIETIERLQERQINLGIVTTKMKHSVKKGLEVTGLTPYFQTVVTLDDVVHAKPHPEPVLKAMHELGGTRETTLMIGDNSHDINAGHHAGVKTAGVAWAQRGKEFLHELEPTYMLDDMTDILDLVPLAK